MHSFLHLVNIKQDQTELYISDFVLCYCCCCTLSTQSVFITITGRWMGDVNIASRTVGLTFHYGRGTVRVVTERMVLKLSKVIYGIYDVCNSTGDMVSTKIWCK